MQDGRSEDVLAGIDALLQEHFGQSPVRASVSFVGVEPVEVLRFEPVPGERAYLSLGMARRPMTGAGELVQQADGPRAELLLQLRDPTDSFGDVWRSLAVLAAAPAVEGVVYSPGMTVDLGEPLAAGVRCSGVLVHESVIGGVDTVAGRVDVLQVVPATATELAWCRVHGSAALRERWAGQELDLLDLARPAADLT
jgi:hypothetical protein